MIPVGSPKWKARPPSPTINYFTLELVFSTSTSNRTKLIVFCVTYLPVGQAERRQIAVVRRVHQAGSFQIFCQIYVGHFLFKGLSSTSHRVATWLTRVWTAQVAQRRWTVSCKRNSNHFYSDVVELGKNWTATLNRFIVVVKKGVWWIGGWGIPPYIGVTLLYRISVAELP